MLKLGVIADAHLCPEGAEVWGSQNDHVTEDPEEGYRLALDLCAREGVDAVVLLGDLSQWCEPHFPDRAHSQLLSFRACNASNSTGGRYPRLECNLFWL